MPTLAKPELIERESPWLEEFDRFYQELCLNKVRILESLGYYEENDLPVPKLDQAGELSEEEEEEEIKPIARALTVAAGASQVLPGAKLLATLKRVSKDPACWQQGRFPEEVELAIARTYQRGDENPGTHWYDVWRGKLAFPEEQIEVPTDLNIAKAALAAVGPIRSTKSRGRPPNLANQIIADELGAIFRRRGQQIVRKRLPVERHGKTAYIEGGPFYEFLGLVLPPLQAYLQKWKLSPVTIDTIVRIATEGYLKTR
jgi:hypothetical protein